MTLTLRANPFDQVAIVHGRETDVVHGPRHGSLRLDSSRDVPATAERAN